MSALLGLVLISSVALNYLGFEPPPIVAASPAASPSAAVSGPAFTYAGTWTLLDLQRHIAGGEVVSVSTAVTDPHDPSAAATDLAAKLVNGQVMRVNLQVTQDNALAALRALGYGSLLTSEALAVANTASGGGFDPSNFLLLGILVVVLFIIVRLMRRGLVPSAARDGAAGFQIILPPPAGLEGETIRPAIEGAPSTVVTMADVAGVEEAKREVTEIIEFLSAPAKFAKLGAKIPHGLLFYGPPGTGKTMLAKAIASEAGVPCIIASGSQFTEMFVGVGPKRVRELFALARRYPAAIIFIDEFDSLAGRRGENYENGEDRKTVNELLTQLDGFRTTDNVVVIAATNRLEALDAAVIRPGRFSRKIHLPLPDVKARREILAVHAANKPLGSDADLDYIARSTAGMSGADLADLLNEAAIFAARGSLEAITAANLRAAWLKVAIGTGRQRSMPARERAIIAAHEAGHAICGRVFDSKTRVAEVSLFAHGLASGEALGFTLSVPDDNALPGESDLWADLIRLMGGRAAEQELFCENTPGAANDFERANQIAVAMVTRWGMGHDPQDTTPGHHGRGNRLSLRVHDENNRVSEATSEAMERAILDILNTAYERALLTVRAEMGRLSAVAAYLFEHERMDGEEFEGLFTGRIPVTAEAISAWKAGTADMAPPIIERPKPRLLAPPQIKASRRRGFPLLPRVARGLADAAGAVAARLEHKEAKDQS
jgi:cell division protease FtsH